ncbi:MAG: lysophospholipid acyltransferase family protein [Oscillospiraceae bacterium]
MPLLRFVMWFFGPLVRFIFRIKTVGAENIPKEGRVILACNHLSAWDPVYIGATQKRTFRTMAKAELFDNKIVAFFISRMGAFPVHRGASDIKSISTAMRILKKDEDMLLIFPEGTRSKDRKLGELHTGVAAIAYKTKTPVVPVYISEKGKPKMFRKSLITYGKPVPAEELAGEEGSEHDKYARGTEKLREAMLALRNEDYE